MLGAGAEGLAARVLTNSTIWLTTLVRSKSLGVKTAAAPARFSASTSSVGNDSANDHRNVNAGFAQLLDDVRHQLKVRTRQD